MLRHLCVLLLAALLPAQITTIANPSSMRQARWLTVPMPAAQADALTEHAVVGGLWIATKARRLGDHTQLWHVRVDVAGGAAGPLGAWEPWPAGVPFPPFGLSPWITDDLDRMLPRVTVVGERPAELAPATILLVENGLACKTWRVSGSRNGWHFVLYAKTWSYQDAVDVAGYVVWSDPSVPSWSVPFCSITLSTGEPLELYFATRNGFVKQGAGVWTLWSGPMAHGVAVPFRGVVLPTDDRPAPHGVDEWRRDLLAAAAQAPLVAAAVWDGQPWLAFGQVPATEERSRPAAFRALLEQPGRVTDERPLANGLQTGMTGAQPPFGATKDAIALAGDAWRVYELLYSAEDYLLRSRHHRELDGSRVTAARHTRWLTWSGAIDEHGADRLGKARPPTPGWDRLPTSGSPRLVYVDDQHRGDAYALAALALTGDEVLLEDAQDSIDVDEARAYAANGWLDSPRASGRLWQSWAKIAVLVPSLRVRVRALALRELAAREAVQLGSPVDPMTIVEDGRVVGGQPGWVPWNEALAVLGALEQEAAWRRLGDPEAADRFRAWAIRHGRNIIQWGTLEPAVGAPLPLAGVLWLEGGAPNPPAYYTWPRSPATDIDVLTPGWWSWFSGAVVAAQLGDRDPVARRAAAIEARFAPGGDTEWREWWAVR